MSRLSVAKLCTYCGRRIRTTEELDRHHLFCRSLAHDKWRESHLKDHESERLSR